MESVRPSLRHRLLAVGLHLGLANLCPASRISSQSAFLEWHYRRALAAHVVLIAMSIFYAAIALLDLYVMIYHRPLYEALPVTVLGYVWLFLAIGVISFTWGANVCRALVGCCGRARLTGHIAASECLLLVGRIGGIVAGICVSVLIAVAIHANTLTTRGGNPAKAYMLYDNEGVFPRWLFNLGFYRMSLAATQKWGEGSVVVDRLSLSSLAEAMRNGKFLFVASHGQSGHVRIGRWALEPEVALMIYEGIVAEQELRLVYLAACEAGVKAGQWSQVFPSAQVKSFDRLSAVPEHIWWLWITGPREFRTRFPVG